MAGYNFKNILLLVWLLLFVFSVPVWADEAPSYSASPSAVQYANAMCTLSADRGNGTYAPIDIVFTASSTVNGKKVSQFTYDFGDGVVKASGGTLSHRFEQGGSYTVLAHPLVGEGLVVNPCKMVLVLKGTTSATPTPTPSPSPAASPSAVVSQPETGPTSVYWLSLIGLFTIWFGAELWYQHNRQTIG
jgi:hypothetical protein